MLEGGPTFKSTSAKFPLHFRMKFSEKHTVLATPTDVTTSRTALITASGTVSGLGPRSLLGKSFDYPHVAGGLNVTEGQIAAIWGRPRSFDLFRPLVQNTVFAIAGYVVKRASGYSKGRGKETLAV